LLENRDHILLEKVSWDEYSEVLTDFEAGHLHARVTYDEGRMEIMTRGDEHERTKKLLARLIQV